MKASSKRTTAITMACGCRPGHMACQAGAELLSAANANYKLAADRRYDDGVNDANLWAAYDAAYAAYRSHTRAA